MEAAIRGEMERVLGRAVPAGSGATFWELGGTSLKAMMLDGWLQREYGVGMGMGRLMQDGSAAGICREVMERRPAGMATTTTTTTTMVQNRRHNQQGQRV